MKKLILLTIVILPMLLKGQSVNIIRQDTIKHVAKGNNTTMYHEGDSYHFDTEKDRFSFEKPVTIEGEPVVTFYQPLDSLTLNVNEDTYFIPGKITFDTTNKLGQFNFFDKNNSTILQPGYETWVPPSCLNNTAATITNGQVVYIDTAISGYPTISLADNKAYESSRIIGVATHDIAPGDYGTVTNYGLVRDVDMTGRESNIVYLGENGNYVYTRPNGGSYPTRIGYALSDDILLVYISTNEYTDEAINTFGFPDYSNNFTTLSFDDATRYFKQSKVGDSYYYYQDGVKYVKSIDSIQIPDAEGLHTIYYENDSIKQIYNANESQIRDIYRSKTIVSQIYWDATNQEHLYLGNQRHTYHIDPYMHEYLHFTLGALYSTGINITGITADGDGNVDTTAQFNITSGGFNNEDIFETTPSLPKGVNLPIFYSSSPLGLARRLYEPGFPVLTDITAGVGTTGRLVYNDSETGTLITVTNNDFVLCHIFALNNVEDSLKLFAVAGQNEYALKADAENGALVEGASLAQRDLPGREGILLFTIIYQTSDSYTNSVKARVVSASDALGNPVDFIDWRSSTVGGGFNGGESAGSFLDLSDTPNSYTGQGTKLVSVTAAEDAVEFIDNVYKDSVGVVSVVHRTLLDSVSADTVTTNKVRSIGTGDILMEKHYADKYWALGSGLDNDFDIKLFNNYAWDEAFGMGISYQGTSSLLSINTNSGLFDLTTDVDIDGHLLVESDDTLYIGSKTDNPAYFLKPTGVTEYTSWKSANTTDYIQLGGEGGQINVYSPNLFLSSNNGGYVSVIGDEVDIRGDVCSWQDKTNTIIATLDMDTKTFIIDNSDFNNTIITDKASFDGEVELLWYEETYAATKTIDFTDGNAPNRYITLTGGTTITVTLPYGTSTLEIIQDATGSHAITPTTSWGTKWNTLDFDTDASDVTIIQFVKSPSGTRYFIGINQH